MRRIILLVTAVVVATAVAGTAIAGTTTGTPVHSAGYCKRHPHRCPSPSPTVTASPSDTTTPSPTPTDSVTPSPTDTATPTPPASTPPASACTDANAYVNWNNEKYIWHDSSQSVAATGGWNNGPVDDYYADADLWNAEGYNVDQYMTVCGKDSFYVKATADDSAGDGAVKTYPNIHKDYIDWATGVLPPLSNYPSLTMSFAHSSPTGPGSWDVAWDVWLNGIGNGNANEVMIWTDYQTQSPAGIATKVGTATLDGVTWDVWSGYSNHYLAFTPSDGHAITSGTFDLIPFTDWLSSHHLIAADSTLGAVDYGVEIVSTGGQQQRWDFSNIAIN